VTVQVSDPVLDKAERYLVSGKVTVVLYDHNVAVFRINGDTGRWTVTRTPGDNWICSCPAKGPTCAHLVAVSQVTGCWEPQ
jgi:hypothetical protein